MRTEIYLPDVRWGATSRAAAACPHVEYKGEKQNRFTIEDKSGTLKRDGHRDGDGDSHEEGFQGYCIGIKTHNHQLHQKNGATKPSEGEFSDPLPALRCARYLRDIHLISTRLIDKNPLMSNTNSPPKGEP